MTFEKSIALGEFVFEMFGVATEGESLMMPVPPMKSWRNIFNVWSFSVEKVLSSSNFITYMCTNLMQLFTIRLCVVRWEYPHLHLFNEVVYSHRLKDICSGALPSGP